MKKYKVDLTETLVVAESRIVIVFAESEEEAEELVLHGEYDEVDDIYDSEVQDIINREVNDIEEC